MQAIKEDEMDQRTNMKASETAGRQPEGGRRADLHRIDLDRVAQTLGSDRHSAGYSRLELMLTAVMPRLVGETDNRS
jgi:hypothetical protein